MLVIDSQNSPARITQRALKEHGETQTVSPIYPRKHLLRRRSTTKLVRKDTEPLSEVSEDSVRSTRLVDDSFGPQSPPNTCRTQFTRVRFAQKLEASLDVSPHRVRKADRSDVWFSSRELKEISNEVKMFLRAHRASASTPKDQDEEKESEQDEEKESEQRDALRGFEDSVSMRASQEFRRRKCGVILAVLEEQRKQREAGCSNDFQMREASRQASKASKTIALERADQDAKDVREKKPAAKGLKQYFSPRKSFRRVPSKMRLSARKLSDITCNEMWQ